MSWFNDGKDWGDYDPYSGHNSNSPILDKFNGFFNNFFNRDSISNTQAVQINEEYRMAKEDFDYMQQVGDSDPDVIERYEQALQDKEALEDYYNRNPKQKAKNLASSKEPVFCNSTEANIRTINLNSYILIYSDTEG